MKRIVILLLGAGVVLLNLLMGEPDWGVWTFLGLFDGFLLLFFLGAWRQVRQSELDRKQQEQRHRELAAFEEEPEAPPERAP